MKERIIKAGFNMLSTEDEGGGGSVSLTKKSSLSYIHHN